MKKVILFLSIFVLCLSSYAEEVPSKKKEANEAAELMVSLDKKPQYDVSKNVIIVKDIFNIAFFVTVAVLALLSYLQAKKTIFSPIKTEIFKYQLKAFEEVIGHFQNKGEIELKDDMDMDSIIDINSFDLFRSYVSTFMKGEVSIDEGFAKEKMSMAKGAIVSKEFAEKYFQLVGIEDPAVPNNESPSDPALKLAEWNDRKYGLVHFTKQYDNATAEIKRFQNSPLLPSGLKELLKDYSKLMDETLSAVGEALEEAGKNMPKNFPTAKKLKNFNPSWISNIHNGKTPKLEPKAIEILNYINTYLGVDDLARDKI